MTHIVPNIQETQHAIFRVHLYPCETCELVKGEHKILVWEETVRCSYHGQSSSTKQNEELLILLLKHHNSTTKRIEWSHRVYQH